MHSQKKRLTKGSRQLSTASHLVQFQDVFNVDMPNVDLLVELLRNVVLL